MCVGFWSLEHPDYSLILCTNRDEFLSRPTTEAHFHTFGREVECDVQEGSVLSGRDVLAGGTWLGINRLGRLALLTNITEPPSKMDSSRGHLVSSYLLSKSSESFEDDYATFGHQDAKYSGFNLLLLSPRGTTDLSFDAAFVTNHGAGGEIESRVLTPDERTGGGMANGIDGQGGNEWPKVQHGIQSLNGYLRTLHKDTSESELTEHLFQLLTWRSAEPPRERSELRNTIHVDPLPIPAGAGPPYSYGTRLSTVILIRRDGQVLFIERDAWKLDEDGKSMIAPTSDPSERAFRFQVPINATS